MLVVHGDNETDAFKAQSARFAGAWAAPVVEVVGRHHFDLAFDLAAIDLRPELWSTTAARVARGGGGGTGERGSARAGGRSDVARPAVPVRVAAGSLRPIASP